MGAVQAPGRVGSGGGLDGAAGAGASERIYARLLGLYPAGFRERYRDEMVVLFGDELRDARAGRGSAGFITTWTRGVLDLVTSAAGEHLRRDRTVAQSLATFQPTRSMRWLGLLGFVGGVLLLAAFLTFDPFEERWANVVRLVTFALGGAGVAWAFYRRQALVAATLALVTAAAVILTGVFYAAWLILPIWIPNPFSGPIGSLNLWASGALWLSAAVYGAAMLKSGAAWQGMPRLLGRATRLGAIALLGSSLAWIGDDRLGWVDSEQYGQIVGTVAMTGVLLNGLGWVLLGAVLLVGGRGSRSGQA